MLAAAVVGYLPARIDDWTLANLDDAITSSEASRSSCLNLLNVRPLILMSVDVIGNLAKENPFYDEGAISLGHKRRV